MLNKSYGVFLCMEVKMAKSSLQNKPATTWDANSLGPGLGGVTAQKALVGTLECSMHVLDPNLTTTTGWNLPMSRFLSPHAKRCPTPQLESYIQANFLFLPARAKACRSASSPSRVLVAKRLVFPWKGFRWDTHFLSSWTLVAFWGWTILVVSTNLVPPAIPLAFGFSGWCKS